MGGCFDLRVIKARLASGAELPESDRAILTEIVDAILDDQDIRDQYWSSAYPEKDLEKKQLAALRMGTFIPERAPTDDMFERIAGEFGLTFDVVKRVYRERVLLGHKVRAALVGVTRGTGRCVAIKSREKSQSDK
jgi:hypothetical protein